MSILTQPSRLRRLARRALDCLLPGSCLLCGEDGRGAVLCPACTDDLPRLPAALCPQCSAPTTHGERCGSCLKEPPHFDRSHALLFYDFPSDRLIHALKYGHQLAVADWLGRQMAQRLAGGEYSLVLPLPLHPQRLCERGFNQSTEIGRVLARGLGLPLDRECLRRSRATPPQAELPLKERRRNVRGAFECARDLSGEHVLLVDDVMTSGATLNECARIVKLHGARQVTIAVAARALRHE